MIAATVQYAIHEVIPRFWRIVGSAHALLSLGIAFATFSYGAHWPIASVRLMDLASSSLAYAAIVFAFSTGGMALVLTFPNQDFISILMRSKLGRREESAYADLLFVFSWTAIVHWSLLIVAVTTLLIRGPDSTILNIWDGAGYRALVGLLFALSFYSVAQFLLTMITLTQVGRVYETQVQKKRLGNKQQREEFIERSLK